MTLMASYTMRRARKNTIPKEIPRGRPSALPLLLPEEESDGAAKLAKADEMVGAHVAGGVGDVSSDIVGSAEGELTDVVSSDLVMDLVMDLVIVAVDLVIVAVVALVLLRMNTLDSRLHICSMKRSM
jgi:hypothetical protein